MCMIFYNSRGFSDIKVEFMKFLLSNSVTGNRVPILCNQENFMLRENAYKLRQALPDYQLLINPAVKKDLTSGRPSNGMFIAFPDNIKNYVTDVSHGFWRVQAVRIRFKSSSLLLINSYFPLIPREQVLIRLSCWRLLPSSSKS